MSIKERQAGCDNCDWIGSLSELLPIKDIFERVEPGEPMPNGECPECGALVFSDELDEKLFRTQKLDDSVRDFVAWYYEHVEYFEGNPVEEGLLSFVTLFDDMTKKQKE